MLLGTSVCCRAVFEYVDQCLILWRAHSLATPLKPKSRGVCTLLCCITHKCYYYCHEGWTPRGCIQPP